MGRDLKETKANNFFQRNTPSQVPRWKSQTKGNMICKDINKKTQPPEEASLLQRGCVASIWKGNARKTLNIHDWHIFFVLSVSWNQSTQLVRKQSLLLLPSGDLRQQLTHGTSYWLILSSLQRWGSGHPASFPHLSSSYQKSTPDPIISLQNKEEKAPSAQ